MWLLQNGIADPDNAGAASTDYMHLFGLTALGYMWARIVKAVLARQAKGDSNPALDAKLILAKFFNERMLPETGAHLARLTAGAGDVDGAAGRGVLTRVDETVGPRGGCRWARTRRKLRSSTFAGGCQCGAVRYRLTAAPGGANVCHCRMCQKAGGAPFMAFAGVKRAQLRLHARRAATLRQLGDFAERGFCAACGTPLTYRMIGHDRIA